MVISKRGFSAQLLRSDETVGGGSPLWKGALVEVHADSVVLHHGSVKVALHVAMRAEGHADVALAAKLGRELDRLEPAHVLRVEEHPTHLRSRAGKLVGGVSKGRGLDANG
eukprot:4928648-Pleurochrysis_carterae.AAC.3